MCFIILLLINIEKNIFQTKIHIEFLIQKKHHFRKNGKKIPNLLMTSSRKKISKIQFSFNL